MHRRSLSRVFTGQTVGKQGSKTSSLCVRRWGFVWRFIRHYLFPISPFIALGRSCFVSMAFSGYSHKFFIWTAKTLIRLRSRTGWSGPEVIKRFSCSTQLNMKFILLINLKLLNIANSFLLNIAEHENFSAQRVLSVYQACLWRLIFG